MSTAERQQMWMAELNRKHILYFGCHSGLGKTCQAEYLAEENYCYWCTIDAEQPAVYARMEQWLKDISGKNARKLVIITNTTYLKEFGQNLQDVMQIINRKIDLNDYDLIIEGRAECPKWLKNYRIMGMVKCFGQDHFFMDDDEMAELVRYELGKMAASFAGEDPEWLNRKTKQIVSISEHYGLGAFYCTELIKQNGKLDIDLRERSRELICEHLERGFVRNFVKVEHDCMEKLSLFQNFTDDMVKGILNRDEQEALERLLEYTTFFRKDKKGIYTINEMFLQFLRKRFFRREPEECRHFMEIAGEICEKKHRYAEALELYKRGQNSSKLKNLLIYMVNNADGTDFLRECQQYMKEFSEEEYKKEPRLLGARIILESCRMRKEKSNQDLKLLEQMAEKEKEEGIYGEARKCYVSSLFALPHKSLQSYQTLVNRYTEIFMNDECVENIVVTGGGPSFINGGKDLTQLLTQEKSLYEFSKKVLTIVIGAEGEGVADAGTGEYYIEKNERIKAMGHLIAGISDIRARGNFRVYYGANAVLARSFMQENMIASAKEVMDNLLGMVDNSDYPEVKYNIYASYVELLLREGAEQSICDWMEYELKSGVGALIGKEFYITNRYRLIVIARVYIALEKYLDASVIIQQLMVYASQYERTYLMIQLHLLCAIVFEADGQDGTQELTEAVLIAAKYGYIRVIADEGAGIKNIWSKVDWQKVQEERKTEIPKNFAAYLRKTEREIKNMASYYPNYLKRSTNGNTLSKSEKAVLQLICKGKTNEQIAEELDIKLSTVKFHVSNIFKKMGVKNRHEAVTKVVELGWFG